MKKRSYLFTIFTLLAFSVIAQVVYVDKEAKSYLNDSTTTSGGYTKSEIIPLLSKHLYSVDKEGMKRNVVSFYFTYKERNVFYDENGRPFIGTDSYTFSSEKGVVDEDVITILNEKIKQGDTIKFESLKSYYNYKESDSSFYSEPITIYFK